MKSKLTIINKIQHLMIILAETKTNDEQFNKVLQELFNELQSYVRILLKLYERDKMNKKELEEFKKDMKAAMDGARLIALQKILMMEREPKKIDIIGKEIDKVIEEIKDEEKKNNES